MSTPIPSRSRARMERALRTLTLVSLAACTGLLAACGDDATDPGDDAGLVGTWEATSFVATGFGDLIEQGMNLTVTLDSNTSGTAAFDFQNDVAGFCDGDSDCQSSGPYEATTAQITLEPGTEDEITFNYTIVGNTMTWVGNIDTGVQATITFQRQ